VYLSEFALVVVFVYVESISLFHTYII